MIPLKYNTASQEIPIGYALDSTDGNTEETALTIANTDIKLWKAGATTLANKNSGGATHMSNGIFYATLDATDTNTYGPLVIFVHVAGALAMRVECWVMNSDAYDALMGTGNLSVLLAAGAITNASLAGNMEVVFETDFATNYNTTRNAWATNVQDTVGTGSLGLNNLSAADVNAEVDTALSDIHLDHLLAADYDPASKPGTATALLNELIESDAGVSRFTANALEQAPGGGGGGDATAANQTTIINHLTDIKGTTWDSTNSLEAIHDDQAAQNDLDAAGVRSAVGLASANLDTQLSTIDTVVDGIQTDLDNGTDGLGAIKAAVDGVQTDLDNGTDGLGAIKTAVDTKSSQSSVDTIDANIDTMVLGIITGSAQTGTLSTTQASTNLSGYADDQLIGRVVTWTSGACDGESTDITDYANTNGVLTFTALTTAPSNGDTFKIT